MTAGAPPSRRRETVERIASALLGLMWLAGAASLVVNAEAEHDFAAMALGAGGLAPKVAVSVAAALEAALGVAMLAGAIRGFVPTLAGLAAASGALVAFRSRFGGRWRCGCMAIVADATIDESLVRNGCVFAATAALLVFGWISARRARSSPDAAAASGPATPAP